MSNSRSNLSSPRSENSVPKSSSKDKVSTSKKIKKAASKNYQTLKNTTAETTQAIKEYTEEKKTAIVDAVKKIADDPLAVLTEIGDGIVDSAQNLANIVANKFKPTDDEVEALKRKLDLQMMSDCWVVRLKKSASEFNQDFTFKELLQGNPAYIISDTSIYFIDRDATRRKVIVASNKLKALGEKFGKHKSAEKQEKQLVELNAYFEAKSKNKSVEKPQTNFDGMLINISDDSNKEVRNELDALSRKNQKNEEKSQIVAGRNKNGLMLVTAIFDGGFSYQTLDINGVPQAGLITSDEINSVIDGLYFEYNKKQDTGNKLAPQYVDITAATKLDDIKAPNSYDAHKAIMKIAEQKCLVVEEKTLEKNRDEAISKGYTDVNQHLDNVNNKLRISEEKKREEERLAKLNQSSSGQSSSPTSTSSENADSPLSLSSSTDKASNFNVVEQINDVTSVPILNKAIDRPRKILPQTPQAKPQSDSRPIDMPPSMPPTDLPPSLPSTDLPRSLPSTDIKDPLQGLPPVPTFKEAELISENQKRSNDSMTLPDPLIYTEDQLNINYDELKFPDKLPDGTPSTLPHSNDIKIVSETNEIIQLDEIVLIEESESENKQLQLDGLSNDCGKGNDVDAEKFVEDEKKVVNDNQNELDTNSNDKVIDVNVEQQDKDENAGLNDHVNNGNNLDLNVELQVVAQVDPEIVVVQQQEVVARRLQTVMQTFNRFVDSYVNKNIDLNGCCGFSLFTSRGRRGRNWAKEFKQKFNERYARDAAEITNEIQLRDCLKAYIIEDNGNVLRGANDPESFKTYLQSYYEYLGTLRLGDNDPVRIDEIDNHVRVYCKEITDSGVTLESKYKELFPEQVIAANGLEAR